MRGLKSTRDSERAVEPHAANRTAGCVVDSRGSDADPCFPKPSLYHDIPGLSLRRIHCSLSPFCPKLARTIVAGSGAILAK